MTTTTDQLFSLREQRHKLIVQNLDFARKLFTAVMEIGTVEDPGSYRGAKYRTTILETGKRNYFVRAFSNVGLYDTTTNSFTYNDRLRITFSDQEHVDRDCVNLQWTSGEWAKAWDALFIPGDWQTAANQFLNEWEFAKNNAEEVEATDQLEQLKATMLFGVSGFTPDDRPMPF